MDLVKDDVSDGLLLSMMDTLYDSCGYYEQMKDEALKDLLRDMRIAARRGQVTSEALAQASP